MKVKELIEKLSSLNEDQNVYCAGNDKDIINDGVELLDVLQVSHSNNENVNGVYLLHE